jgi:hypothetical protein
MNAPIRERLIKAIETLGDEQVNALYNIVQFMLPKGDKAPPYDPDKDTMIGMFSGPIDLSERAEEILQEETDPASGWTQKGKDPL